MYPVSAVMKFWHWLLTGALGVGSSKAWAASVFLLVLSVRAIILPFAWQTYKSTRTSFLMRPHMDKVTEQYGESTDIADLRAEDEARKQIQKEHGYNPFAACVPALIQIPTFLGLYRLLLWMAVPDAAAGKRLGVLSDDEIASFRDSTFFDVPLAAYASMTQEQFAFLGTTEDEVIVLAAIMILLAITFTSTNMLLTQVRNRFTLEWANTTSRRAYYFIYWVIPLVGLSLLIAGLTGRVPVALLMYWVINNLFTAAQNAFLWFFAVRTMPATPLHREAQAAAHAKVKEERRKVKEGRAALRRQRASILTHPSEAGRISREIRQEKRARKEKKAAEKAEAKALKKERNLARKELNKLIAAEKAAEKQAKKDGGATLSGVTIEGSTRWSPEQERA